MWKFYVHLSNEGFPLVDANLVDLVSKAFRVFSRESVVHVANDLVYLHNPTKYGQALRIARGYSRVSGYSHHKRIISRIVIYRALVTQNVGSAEKLR